MDVLLADKFRSGNSPAMFAPPEAAKNFVYRLYKEEGLALRRRPKGRCRAVVHRQERFRPTKPNQVWAMDFGAP